MLKILGLASVILVVIGMLIVINVGTEKTEKAGYGILILGAAGFIGVATAGAIGIIPVY